MKFILKKALSLQRKSVTDERLIERSSRLSFFIL